MLNKLKESALPIFLLSLVIGVCFLFDIIPLNKLIAFLIGGVLIIVGQVLFVSGAENSISKIGKHFGSSLIKLKKVWIILLFGAIFGFLTTIAEPDLSLLSNFAQTLDQTTSKIVFIFVVGLGVGIFTLVAFGRILKSINLKYVLMCIYALIIILAFFLPNELIALSFDASGMTTGPITIPFLLSLSLGLCCVGTKNKDEKCFGVIAITSAGSILAVEILSFFIKVSPTVYNFEFASFFEILKTNVFEVVISTLPILIIFIIMQFVSFKFPKKYVLRIIFSFIIANVGLIIFLTGVIYGFAPMGAILGKNIGSKPLLFLISILFGGILVFSEPAVRLLLNQIQEATSNTLKSKHILISISVSVILALVFSLLKIIFNIKIILFIIPVLILIFVLSFFTPNLFFSIAFDSGGVVAGTMLVSFILPFFMGISNNFSSNSSGAFGVICLVSLLPILSIEILGIIYKKKSKKGEKNENQSSSNER